MPVRTCASGLCTLAQPTRKSPTFGRFLYALAAITALASALLVYVIITGASSEAGANPEPERL